MDDKILISIASATAALCGVIVSQAATAILAWIDRRHKRRILLREKYEELCLSFLASFDLPQKLLAHEHKNDEVRSLVLQKDANHAHMLALLYFQELLPSLERYTQTYSDLCVVCFGLADPSLQSSIGGQVCSAPEYITARDAHILARDSLREKIEKHASKYAVA